MFGLPQQTVQSFAESLTWCHARSTHPGAVSAFPLMLLRGTPLHERKEQLGLTESTQYNDCLSGGARQYEGIPHVVSSPSFSVEDWRTMASMAQSGTAL
jgi:hypothetical protein